MTGNEKLKYFQGNWPTNKGAWFPGEKVLYRQKSLFDDFSDARWSTLLLYGIDGRYPSENHSLMIEKIWSISSSFPDPRLWNNRIAALAGTARSTGSLAIAGATAVTEAKIYGTRPVFLGCKFLADIREKMQSGQNLEDIVLAKLREDRVLPGFGRPVTSRDERVIPLLNTAEKLGFSTGHYVNLVHEIEQVLKKNRYKLNANIAIYCSAIFSDLGYTPGESYMIAVLAFSAGMIPCYLDALEKPEGCLFPLDCTTIKYNGQEKRSITNEK